MLEIRYQGRRVPCANLGELFDEFEAGCQGDQADVHFSTAPAGTVSIVAVELDDARRPVDPASGRRLLFADFDLWDGTAGRGAAPADAISEPAPSRTACDGCGAQNLAVGERTDFYAPVWVMTLCHACHHNPS